MKSAQLFIDYQNLHLSAHERFAAYGVPIHKSLIHPARFADCLEIIRNDQVHQAVHIEKIHVFRGQPSNENDPEAARRNKMQAAEWTRDRRVTMYSRPLRYPRDWPDEAAREKGVDVALAVTYVRAAMEKWADTLILASRDTDLLPALETAKDIGGCIVEVAGWNGDSRLSFRGNERGRLWGTKLDDAHFHQCCDPRDYL